MSKKEIKLPDEIGDIYRAVRALERRFPGRKFTPDGHLVGSIGEVIAAEAFDLELLPSSSPAHDAKDKQGRLVQIKLTQTNGISMNDNCERLIAMQILKDKSGVELIYDGDGDSVWNLCGKKQKNGQRRVSFSRLSHLPGFVS